MSNQILLKKSKQQCFAKTIDIIDAVKNGDFTITDTIKISCNIYKLKLATDDVVLYTCGHDTILILEDTVKIGNMFTYSR